MRGEVRFRAAQTHTTAGSRLISALRNAKLEVCLVALYVRVTFLVRGVVASTLPESVHVGNSGGRLRLQKVRRAHALLAHYDGPVGDTAVTETPPETPLLPRCLNLLLTGAEAMELEVVRGRHLHLRRGIAPWAAKDSAFEQLRVPPNSVLV